MTPQYMAVMMEIIEFKEVCTDSELETMFLAEQAIVKAKVSSAIELMPDPDAE